MNNSKRIDSFEKQFRDRTDAGYQLAERLKPMSLPSDTVILGFPRGGVVVADTVAETLRYPLDTFVVRKLSAPGQQELVMGAVASGGVILLNEEIIKTLGLSKTDVDRIIEQEMQELLRKERLYRDNRPPINLRHRSVILIDDGIAIPSAMLAAMMALKKSGLQFLMVAVPVGSVETCAELHQHADHALCLITPAPFYSVETWYGKFPQVSDREVHDLLEKARHRPSTM